MGDRLGTLGAVGFNLFFLQSFLFYRRIDEKMVKYMYFRYIFLGSFIFPGDFLLKCLDLKEKIQKKSKKKIFSSTMYMDLKKNQNSYGT